MMLHMLLESFDISYAGKNICLD